jgi:hypothetical protein
MGTSCYCSNDFTNTFICPWSLACSETRTAAWSKCDAGCTDYCGDTNPTPTTGTDVPPAGCTAKACLNNGHCDGTLCFSNGSYGCVSCATDDVGIISGCLSLCCGDGICRSGAENSSNCPSDCAAPVIPTATFIPTPTATKIPTPTATKIPTPTATKIPTPGNCGARDEVCCTGNVCDLNSLTCTGGYCRCGAETQICCSGNSCNSNLYCVGNVCVKPTSTPTVTPTSVQKVGVLNFKVSFLGKPSGGLCASWPVDVKVVDQDGNEKVYEEVPTNDEGVGKVTLTGFNAKEKLMVYFAGPKQGWTKYGENNQTEQYKSDSGQITVTDDETTSIKYNFSKYPILSGDVIGDYESTNDKKISSRDFSKTKVEALDRKKTEEGDDLYGDVDGNCVTNSLDITTVMLSLKRNQSEW